MALAHAQGVEVTVVKQRGTVERTRARVQGAFGTGKSRADREVRQAATRDANRLDERERAELLGVWSGTEAAVGMRSVHGAVEDALLRSPPRLIPEFERFVVEFLRPKGEGGAPRDKLVELLAQETAADPWGRRVSLGATRHEARLALRKMAGDGRVGFFVGRETRPKPCTCRSPMGEVDGVRVKLECRCGSGEPEEVPRQMVRLSPGARTALDAVGPALTREERWARDDAALEASWREVTPHETRGAWGSGVPPHVRTTDSDRTRGALRKLAPQHRRVLERAYAPSGVRRWEGVLSEECERLAVAGLLDGVERARLEVAAERVGVSPGSLGTPEAIRTALRSTFPVDALRARFDQVPEGEVARIRFRVAREELVGVLEGQAHRAIAAAVKAFRDARGR